MTQITFETFNVPTMYVASQTTSSLCASGHTSGTVAIPGDGVSHTVCTLHHAILRWPGRDLTEHLTKILIERRYSFTTNAGREIVRDVKKQRCYIGLDYDTELKSTAETDKEKTHLLSDENITTVGAERFHCVGILFQPSLIGKEANGCHDTSFQYIKKCDVDLRKICTHVVLSGGMTMFQGIVEHMTKELTALAPSTMRSRWLLRFGMDWRIYLVYVLPDGNIITVGAEWFLYVEVFFKVKFHF